MACSNYGGRIPCRSHLDRHLLHQLDRIPNPSYWGLEHGGWLWLRSRWFYARYSLALTSPPDCYSLALKPPNYTRVILHIVDNSCG